MGDTTQIDIDRNAYAVFIGQIELHKIWLKSATVENFHGPVLPEELSIAVDGESEWVPLPDGFRAFQHYRIRLSKQEEELLAEIAITFGADYESALQMDETLFVTFGDVNLPLNTWPYLREYASTTVSRMGWLPITLPALKVGAVPRSAKQAAEPTQTKAKRRRTSSKPLPKED